MKKIYLKPEIDCVATNTQWALCSQGGTKQDNGEQPGAQPGGVNFPNPAPKKPVF